MVTPGARHAPSPLASSHAPGPVDHPQWLQQPGRHRRPSAPTTSGTRDQSRGRRHSAKRLHRRGGSAYGKRPGLPGQRQGHRTQGRPRPACLPWRHPVGAGYRRLRAGPALGEKPRQRRDDENRYQRLANTGAVSRQIFDQSATNLRVAEAELAAAQSDASQIENRRTYSVLKADGDGIVTDVRVDRGQVVAEGPMTAPAKPSSTCRKTSATRPHKKPWPSPSAPPTRR